MASILDQFKALGMITEEQEKNYEKEEKRKEQAQQKEQKNKLNRMEQYSRNKKTTGGKYGRAGSDFFASNSAKPAATATAPYNFIPLPEKILTSPLNDYIGEQYHALETGITEQETARDIKKSLTEEFQAFLREKGKYNGEIRLTLKNITPLFIGGNGGKTFAPAGIPIIPGSTIRGMTKNLIKILTCGGWQSGEDLTNRHLYYRCLIASNNELYNKGLNKAYTDRMVTDENGKIKKKARPGFLVKRGKDYVIYPTLNDKVHAANIKEYLESRGQTDPPRKSAVQWDGVRAYVITGMRNGRDLQSKEEIDNFFATTPKTLWSKIGKQYYRYMLLSDIDKSKCYEVPPEVANEYRSDKNRRGVDLIAALNDNKNKKSGHVLGEPPKNIIGLEPFDGIIPCFYFLDDNQLVKSFGHGQSFRIPYLNSIYDAVPTPLHEKAVDFAAAMFGISGKAVSWASRLHFGDAKQKKNNNYERASKHQPLMQPNPTSFQLYLEQDNKEELVHWDSATPKIRGYKLYWHHKNCLWQASNKQKENERQRNENAKELSREIEPLKPGAEFVGSISFHDLTKEELGALLTVFHPDDKKNIVYKIGQGKPLGLGSVEIKSTLYIEDGSRYQKLFDADGFHNSLQKADPAEYMDAFDQYATDKGCGSEYKEARQNLSLMLDYDNTQKKDWDKVIAPINGDTKDKNNHDERFKKRNILPDIASTIKMAQNGAKI